MRFSAGSVAVNSVVLITTLPSADAGPSVRLAEDLRSMAVGGAFDFYWCPAANRAEFDRHLAWIERRAAAGMRPLIHIDGHGDKDKGLEVGGSDRIQWELLVGGLRAVNVATHNNLMVVLASCEAFHVIREVTLLEKVPFYVLLAPDAPVDTGLLSDRLAPFYRALFLDEDVEKARGVLGGEFKYFHAERLLVIAIGKYLRGHSVGQKGRRHREQLLTQVVEALGISDPSAVSDQRKQIKKILVPMEAGLLDRWSKRFLFDRQSSASMDDILGMVRQQQ